MRVLAKLINAELIDDFYDGDEPNACSVGNCPELNNGLFYIGLRIGSIRVLLSFCSEHYALFRKEALVGSLK